jgi:DNA polymerase-4
MPTDPHPVIVHADMDAFYAAVEERDRPELRGLPIVVGGPPPRGVVTAASYAARKYGIHSAMPSAEAHKRCPDAVFLPGDMAKYARESRHIREIFETFSPDVEPLSLDEAFIDVTRSQRALGGTPLEIGRKLKERVRAATGLTVSVGIAPVKMVAKIASDLSKPDGLLEVRAEDVASFLAPLPVARLWGVGVETEELLVGLGLMTIGDLAALGAASLDERFVARLQPKLLARVLHLAALARGEDARAVEPDREARSYGEENTFAVDVADLAVLDNAIVQHADAVARRLRHDGACGDVVRLKVKSTERLRRPGRYRLHSRQVTLAEPTDDGTTIARHAMVLLHRGDLPLPIRLLGVTVAGIQPAMRSGGDQLQLFVSRARSELNRALDTIVARHGNGAIRRGAAGVTKAAPSLGVKRGE